MKTWRLHRSRFPGQKRNTIEFTILSTVQRTDIYVFLVRAHPCRCWSWTGVRGLRASRYTRGAARLAEIIWKLWDWVVYFKVTEVIEQQDGQQWDLTITQVTSSRTKSEHYYRVRDFVNLRNITELFYVNLVRAHPCQCQSWTGERGLRASRHNRDAARLRLSLYYYF